MKVLNKVLEVVLVFLMVALVFDVFWQVFARYVLVHPSSFTDELARYLFIWVGYLGAAYGTGKKIHLAVDLLAKKLAGSKWANVQREAISFFIIIFATLVFLIGGGRLVYLTIILDQRSSALGVPLGLVYAVIPISGLIIIAYSINDILQNRLKLT